jgi:hypothetical protein
MTVYFHGSFGLNRKYMAKIIEAALKEPKLKDKDLGSIFGYGAPFSSRYRSWLHKTGIIELGFPIKLTQMGNIVVNKDPDLKTRTTQWFIHHELTTDPLRAEAWYFFANEFLPSRKKFTKSELMNGLTEKLKAHDERHFGSGSPLNKVILRKIIECYTADYALGSLGIIHEKDGKFVRGETKIKGPWETPEKLSRAY